MKNMINKILSVTLVTVLALTMLPPGGMTVRAASDPDNYVFDVSGGDVTVSAGSSAGYLKVSYGGGSTTPEFPDTQEITITGSSNSHAIWVVSGNTAEVNLILENVSIDTTPINGCAMAILYGSTANITLKGENTLKSGADSAGLEVSGGNNLNITAASTGSLSATGGGSNTSGVGGAGIGGNGSGGPSSGRIVINGGTIAAKGNSNGAGIGSGIEGNADITINGGTVTAAGGTYGAGIGGGAYGSGTVTITGGTVTATGGIYGGADIGGGWRGSGTVTISGGSVNADLTVVYYDGAHTLAYPVTVNLEDISTVTDISYMIDGGSAIGCSTDSSGNICLWLPLGSRLIQASSGTSPKTYYQASGTVNTTGNNFIAYKGLVITSQPADTAVQAGETATLSVEATGPADLRYQWYSNTSGSSSGGTEIPDATDSSYTAPAAVAGEIYYYYCIVSMEYDSITYTRASDPAAVAVLDAVITSQPSGASVPLGEAVELTIDASGYGTLNYQWYRNTTDSTSGGTAVSGATSSSYSALVDTIGSVYYYCVVTDTVASLSASETSDVVCVTATGRDTFDVSEGDITILSGADAGHLQVIYGSGPTTIEIPNTQEITITGSSASHAIWMDRAVSSETEVNLILKDVYINVTPINSCAFTISSKWKVNLTLEGENTLISGADSAGLKVTGDAKLNITAASTGTLSATGGGNGGAGIGGSNHGSSGRIVIDGGRITAAGGYSAAGIGGGNQGSGTVTVNGGAITATGGSYGAGIGGGVYSDNTSVTINGGVIRASGGTEGAGIGSCRGAGNTTVTISGGTVTATGGPLTTGIGSGYDNQNNKVVISGGSVNASISTAYYDSAQTTRAYFTTVTLEDITTATAVSYTADSGSVTACSTDGSGKLYLWLPVTGGTTNILAAAGSSHKAAYLAAGNVTTGSNNFTARKVPKITAQPVNKVVSPGQTATLSVTATGAGTLGYQWYRNTTNSNSGGAAIDGAAGSSYTAPAAEDGTVYYYYCVVTMEYNSEQYSTVSTAAAVAVLEVTINTQPNDLTVIRGGSAELSISAQGAGTGTLSYQWYSNTTDSNSGGSMINGATGSSYSASTSAAGIIYYYCVVTDSYGSASDSKTSDVAAVTVVGATITAEPQDLVVRSGSAAALTLTAGGTGTLSYQWYSNTTDSSDGGSMIDGATDRTYSAPTSAAGTLYYYCIVTDTAGSIGESETSEAAAVTVVGAVITAQPSDVSVFQNGSAELSISARGAGTNTLSYQWYSNTTDSGSGGTAIDGATDRTYSVPTSAVGTIYYYCVVTDTVGSISDSKTSDSAAVTVTAAESLLTITGQPSNLVARVGNTAELTVTVTSAGTLTYQWYSNTTDSSGGSAIGGATNNTYLAPTASVGITYYYCVITETILGRIIDTKTSNIVSVTVVSIPTATGNGAFGITPEFDSVYTTGLTSDGKFSAMTVNQGVTGFKYFSVNIEAAAGHSGMETTVFVQIRDGQQIGISFNRADYDTVHYAGTGFNVKPGDIIEVYVVDTLSNTGGSPEIL